jgi:FAD/FMN-containing dehydrogenase
MSRMRAVTVDPATQTAWVQPGATSGDIAAAAQPHGLALTTGDAASVGIGGLATGGGIGWMVRKYGLTIDHMLAAEVVTADGEIVRASAESHADLFWAVRGGGGNFGIITGFEFRLDRVGMILGGVLVLPATAEVLRGVAEYGAEAPEELSLIAQVMHAPPAPFVPQEMHGKLITAVLVVYTGDADEGQRALGPLRALATPIADVVMPMPYPGIFQFTEEASKPHANSVRSLFLDELDDELTDAMIRLAEIAPSPIDMIQLRPLGGAMARVPSDATAFAHRERKFMLSGIAIWMEPHEATANRAWAEAFWELAGDRAQGAYVNFLADDGARRIGQAYPPATYARLAEVKRAYDPDNVFRGNQNVAP